MNHADIGVVERGGSPRLLKKALFIFRPDIEFVGKKLEGYGAVEFEIERFINNAHTADTGSAENFVAADLFIYGEWAHRRCHCDLQRSFASKILVSPGES